MIHLPASVRVYLCLTACDMRKSFDGLHQLVREHLELDAFGGHLFVFGSRRRDRIKILYWGPRRIRDVEQTTGGRDVRDAAGRERGRTSAGDNGTGVGGTAERNRPEPSQAAQTISTLWIKHCCLCSFLLVR